MKPILTISTGCLPRWWLRCLTVPARPIDGTSGAGNLDPEETRLREVVGPLYVTAVIMLRLTGSSLTAVVQGAVIYGIEKSRHSGVRRMSAITKSYGIVLSGRFEWLIRKGDSVLSTEKKRVYSKYFSIPLKTCPARKYDMVIYTYKKRDEDDDDVPDSWEDGQHGR